MPDWLAVVGSGFIGVWVAVAVWRMLDRPRFGPQRDGSWVCGDLVPPCPECGHEFAVSAGRVWLCPVCDTRWLKEGSP